MLCRAAHVAAGGCGRRGAGRTQGSARLCLGGEVVMESCGEGQQGRGLEEEFRIESEVPLAAQPDTQQAPRKPRPGERPRRDSQGGNGGRSGDGGDKLGRASGRRRQLLDHRQCRLRFPERHPWPPSLGLSAAGSGDIAFRQTFAEPPLRKVLHGARRSRDHAASQVCRHREPCWL